MFGDGNQNQNSGGQSASPVPAPAPDVVAGAPSAPTIPDPMVTPTTLTPTNTNPADIAQPEAGINGVSTETAYTEPVVMAAEPDSTLTADSMVPAPPAAVDGDLASIKQQALQSLEPLVGQLDLAPEEKYKTIMMVVQASDKPKMLEEAYQAASQITDEKVRAQALLDIVNEVNYFTQQQPKG